MAVLSYPGVYVKEVPSGVRSITGVATSITAFVGRALRGPVDEAVTITSYADFERTHGGLWVDSWLGYAVRDFYQQGGGVAVIVRVHKPTSTDFASIVITLGTETLSLRALAPGAAGDVVTAKVTASTKNNPPADEFDLTVTGPGGASESFKDVSYKTGQPNSVNAIASSLVTVQTLPASLPASLATTPANGTTTGHTTSGRATIDLGSGGTLLRLNAASPGAWGVKLTARRDLDTPDPTTMFNLTVTDTGTGKTEIFRNVSYLSGHPRRVDIVVANESRLVAVDAMPTTTVPTAIPASATAPAVAATLGNDGDPIGQAQISTATGMRAAKRGLYALAGVDLVNLIVVPPYNATDDVDPLVLTDAIAYATERRAMLVMDFPGTPTSVGQAVAAASLASFTHSPNAAVYFPRLRMRDPLRDGQLGTFPTAGAVAGVVARTDATRGVWKAPAGLDAKIDGVAELSVPLTDLEIGQLNPLGVNCLRAAPGAGHVVWGARTRDGADRMASESKYISVRRTALFLEESLYRGMQWVVFEPNDAPLWAQIRLNAGAFMNGLFRQAAFAGTSPKEAYYVKCDAETTTQDDVNAGIVNIHVGFAPLKPAEFVQIFLQQMAGQAGDA